MNEGSECRVGVAICASAVSREMPSELFTSHSQCSNLCWCWGSRWDWKPLDCCRWFKINYKFQLFLSLSTNSRHVFRWNVRQFQYKLGTDTSKAHNAGVCITCVAQSFQLSCLCTLHDIKHLPQHGAGQSAIWHLWHKQPNAQPVRGPQIIHSGITFNRADFLPFVSEHVQNSSEKEIIVLQL